MKYVLASLMAILLMFNQGFCNSKQIGNKNVTFFKFDNFVIHVYPSLNLDKGDYSISTGSFENTAGNEDELVSFWTGLITEKITLYSVDWNLLVGEKYFKIPRKCKELWLIENMLVGCGIGEIPESKLPKEFETALNANRCDVSCSYNSINFVVKGALLHGYSKKYIDEEKYVLIVGGRHFTVSNGKLEYSGKNYGPLHEGDTVVVNRDGNLNIISDK